MPKHIHDTNWRNPSTEAKGTICYAGGHSGFTFDSYGPFICNVSYAGGVGIILSEGNDEAHSTLNAYQGIFG